MSKAISYTKSLLMYFESSFVVKILANSFVSKPVNYCLLLLSTRGNSPSVS